LAPGYLATSGQEVDFIQWTRQGNSFSGSFNAVYITGSPPSANTQPKQGTASGSIDGFNTAKGGPGSGGGIFNGTRGTVTLLASLVVANTPDNCFGC
jgi:hypothetical protein